MTDWDYKSKCKLVLWCCAPTVGVGQRRGDFSAVQDAEAFVVFNPGDFAFLLSQKGSGGIFFHADAVSGGGCVQHVKVVHCCKSCVKMNAVNAGQVLRLTDFDYLNGKKDNENMPRAVENGKGRRTNQRPDTLIDVREDQSE